MTRVMQALYKEFKQEGIEEGKKEGIEEGKMETAKKMLEDKIDINLIAKYTGLMIKEIQGLMKDDRD